MIIKYISWYFHEHVDDSVVLRVYVDGQMEMFGLWLDIWPGNGRPWPRHSAGDAFWKNTRHLGLSGLRGKQGRFRESMSFVAGDARDQDDTHYDSSSVDDGKGTVMNVYGREASK